MHSNLKSREYCYIFDEAASVLVHKTTSLNLEPCKLLFLIHSVIIAENNTYNFAFNSVIDIDVGFEEG
jgi:hypothetical protein